MWAWVHAREALALQPRLPPRYRVIEEVGQGGMAVVYRAQDETLRREVAVKVLHPHLLTEAESKARLGREAQAVAKLRHDNIVQIYDYSGDDSPSSYIVTEFVDGVTLKQFLARREGLKIAHPEVAALIVAELAAALQHAHGLGIIHRDLKPENVMVRKDGVLKLMDFGVAQVLDLERMTVTGQLLGSPAYMAPELLEGKPLDFRTDVFALGVMLYQLSTGELPFSGRNPHEVFKRISEGRYPDPRGLSPLVSDALTRIIARALARKPDDRYPNLGPLLDDLVAFTKDAGLDSPRAELERYFREPEAYEAALPARLRAGLLASGKRAREARKLAQAIALWNRALAIAPDDPEVLAELRRLEGGRLLRNGVLGLGAVLALGAAWKLVPWPASRPHDEPPPVPAPSPQVPATFPQASAPPEVPATPPPATVAPAPSPAPATPLPIGKRPRKPIAVAEPAATAERVRFTLAPTPAKVDVFLDRQFRFTFDVGNDTLEVPWDGGSHQIELRHPCCFPKVINVGPSETPWPNNHIVARLSGKPASLTIKLEPERPGAHIFIIDDNPIRKNQLPAEPGVPVTIRFDPNEEIRKSLGVSVFAPGPTPGAAQERVAYQTVDVTAGDTKATVTIRVP